MKKEGKNARRSRKLSHFRLRDSLSDYSIYYRFNGWFRAVIAGVIVTVIVIRVGNGRRAKRRKSSLIRRDSTGQVIVPNFGYSLVQ